MHFLFYSNLKLIISKVPRYIEWVIVLILDFQKTCYLPIVFVSEF